MGKTPKPLRILVHLETVGEATIRALQDKGHTVDVNPEDGDCPWSYDLILAPQACRFLPGMEFLLDELVKGARKVRYPKEPR